MMKKRMLAVTLSLAAGMVAALIPSAQATTAAVQQNVRHVANVPGATGGHVAVDGNRLYVGAYGMGMRIFDITNPVAPVQIGQYMPGFQSASDPGLRADAVPDALVMNGKHIAALNGTNRAAASQQTEFLDVTNAAAPVLLHRFTGSADGEAHNGDIVDARRLWLPSGGSSTNGLRIYDLSPLVGGTPAAPARLFGGNPHTLWQTSKYRGSQALGPAFNHTHDIEVYTDYNLLLHESDWVDQNDDGIPDPTYAKRDVAFLAGSQGYSTSIQGVQTTPNGTATYIIDITDPRNPVVINKIHSLSGHTVRYLHEVQLLDGDPHVMISTDEDLHNGCEAGGVTSYRLSDNLASATKLDEWFIGTGTPAPVCSSHVFSSKGNYMFMGSYQAGLQVVDFSNPADLKRAGQYIAEGADSWGALFHKGYVYVGDLGGRGLDVFQFVANPVASAILKAPNPSSRTQFSVSEQGCVTLNDPHGPTDQVDALMVTIPESVRAAVAAGEDHIIRGVGAGDAATDVDIWFYDENCAYMAGPGVATDSGAVEQAKIGSIDNGEGEPRTAAKYASVVLYTGHPGTRVYAQIDPPF